MTRHIFDSEGGKAVKVLHGEPPPLQAARQRKIPTNVKEVKMCFQWKVGN